MISEPVCPREQPVLHHVRHGRRRGAPIVLLHGLGSSSADWPDQVAAFAPRFPVIAVDLPAHGRSPRLPETPGVDGMAEGVAALLRGLGEEPAHVVGLSLGGCVGLALALRDPEAVRSLTIVNAFARLRPVGVAGLWRMLRRVAVAVTRPMPVVAADVARAMFPHPGQEALRRRAAASLAANDRWTYLALMRAVAGFDVRTRLAEVRRPTLVITGAADTTVPRAAQALLAQRITGSRWIVVPDSGHATPHDQPAAFNRHVLDFIGALGPAPAS